MAPVITIALIAAIGYAMGGISGLFLGGMAGFFLTLLVGVVWQKSQVGYVPRSERQKLAAHMMHNYSDLLVNAFPETQGPELRREIEERIEGVVTRAISIAPSNSAVMSQQTIREALQQIALEEPSEGIRQFYSCLLIQMAKDWYPIS